MIILAGIPTESPLVLVSKELHKLNVPFVMFNQRNFQQNAMEFEICAGWITGLIKFEGRTYRLEDIHGVYTRLMDDQLLPELKGEPAASPKRKVCRDLHDTFIRWCEIAPIRVVNRGSAMASNSSKPYQSQLICKQGFHIPQTLITNDPDLVVRFRNECGGKIIYKSISGVRSIVQILKDDDLARLDCIRWCPVQFQEFIEGRNTRVHVIGDRVFATTINTDAVDYRYAHTQGRETCLKPIDVTEDLATKCINLSRSLGLAFSGIDLKITEKGEAYCLEVNPSPAFSYYELNTGQPIAQAVAHYLSGLD